MVDGRAPISALEEYVDLGIKDKGFDTVSGLILNKIGRIPHRGEIVKFQNAKMIIEDASPRTVKRIKVVKS